MTRGVIPGIAIGSLRVWSRGDTGLFACQGSPSRRDMEAALAFWRAERCRRALGPVSPAAADTGGGLCVWRSGEPAELLGTRRVQDGTELMRLGFRAAGEELAMRGPLPDLPARTGVSVRPGVTPEECARVLEADPERTRAALDALSPYLSREFSFTAFRSGPAGFALCLRRGRSLRLLTLWTRPDCRNGMAAMPLLRAVADAARRAGIGEIDAARIPADNPHSLRLARAMGGRIIARYRIYERDIG